MSTDGSLTRWAHELHAPEASRRDEAARQLWTHFAERLRALVRRHLDPRFRRRSDEDDIVQSLFAGYDAAKPGPDGPPRSRADLWRLLVHIALCKVANTADRHRAARCDVHRVQPLGDFDDADPGVLSPEAKAVASDEFDRLLALLPDDLQWVLPLRLEGYTVAGTAARLGWTYRSIELKLKTIRSLLAPRLRVEDAVGNH